MHIDYTVLAAEIIRQQNEEQSAQNLNTCVTPVNAEPSTSINSAEEVHVQTLTGLDTQGRHNSSQPSVQNIVNEIFQVSRHLTLSICNMHPKSKCLMVCT